MRHSIANGASKTSLNGISNQSRLWCGDTSLRKRIILSARGGLLTAGRGGQHSIRINDQYRICFRWEAGDAHEVEIADYH